MKRFISIVAVMLLFTFNSTAVQAQKSECNKGNTGKVVGAVVGSVLGGILGRKIDGGNNKATGTIIGGLIGGLAGSAIGKSLDKCEKEKLDKATYAALNDENSGNNTPQTWVSDSRPDVHGTVTASKSKKLADGRECRVATRIAYVDGEEVTETPNMCRVPPKTEWAAT